MTLGIATILVVISVSRLIFLLFMVTVVVLIDKIKACFKIARIIFGGLMRNEITVLICVVGLVLRVSIIPRILIPWVRVQLLPVVGHLLVVRAWITLIIHLRTALRAVARIIVIVTILAWMFKELLTKSSRHKLFPDGNLIHLLHKRIVVGTIWIVLFWLRTLQLKTLNLFYMQRRLLKELLRHKFITQLSRRKTLLHILFLLLKINIKNTLLPNFSTIIHLASYWVKNILKIEFHIEKLNIHKI